MHFEDMIEFIESIPEDVRQVEKPRFDFFNQHNPVIQPFIKELSQNDTKHFVSWLNQNVGNYIYMNEMINMVTVAKQHVRNDLPRNRLDKQLNKAIDKLKRLTGRLPDQETIAEKINELESIINDSLEVIQEPMEIKRPTKKDDVEPKLRQDLRLLSIQVNDYQINTLLKEIPTYS